MNAEYRAPGDDGQQPRTPADAAPRREGVLGASTQVPQRTAFRPVTGTQPQGAPAARPAATPYAPPASVAPGAPATGARPAGNPAAPTHVPGTVPPGAPRAAAPGAPLGSAPVAASAAGTATVPPAVLGGPSGAQRPATGTVPARAATLKPGDTTASGAPRKVRVLVARVDPWSVLKLGFLLSIAAGIMLVVAIHVVWSVLNSMGTFDMINDWVERLFPPDASVNIEQYFEYSKVLSATVLVAVTNVVLLSGLSVVGAFLYNIVAKVVGGVYVTLTDD